MDLPGIGTILAPHDGGFSSLPDCQGRTDVRSRLKLETVEFFANRVCDSLIEASPPWFEGRRTFLLDGTTFTLAPTPELKAAFPPAGEFYARRYDVEHDIRDVKVTLDRENIRATSVEMVKKELPTSRSLTIL